MAERVIWKPHEREWLAKRVARAFIRHEFDALAATRDDLEREMMGPLREAISEMTNDRRREIGGPAHVEWLTDMLLEMTRAHVNKPSKYPSDILTRTASDPVEPSSKNGPEPFTKERVPIERVILPDGFVLIPRAEWSRAVRSLRRSVRGSSARFDKIEDQLSTLIELFLENNGAGGGSIAQESRHFVVVVAGLSSEQLESVEEVLADLPLELIGADLKGPPTQVTNCDWVVATKNLAHAWIAEARRLAEGRMTIVSDYHGVVQCLSDLMSGQT
jgi:hypothetical protein